MSRFKLLGFTAISWLPLLAMASVSQANTYDAAGNWLATYATTTSVSASSSATWASSAGNTYGVWSAGEFSWNWTNQEATVGNTSLQALPTYYSPSTGYQTSGATVTATYTYTVPWVQYQLNPGTTIHQQTGSTFTEMIGRTPEKGGGSDSGSISLPTGITTGGATSGYITEVAAVKSIPSSSAVMVSRPPLTPLKPARSTTVTVACGPRRLASSTTTVPTPRALGSPV